VPNREPKEEKAQETGVLTVLTKPTYRWTAESLLEEKMIDPAVRKAFGGSRGTDGPKRTPPGAGGRNTNWGRAES